MRENAALIQVLKAALWREREKIERAKLEIIKLKLDLLELGIELSEEEEAAEND